MIDPQQPGADLVLEGLADLGARRVSLASLLVAIGRPRLVLAGLDVPAFALELEDPQLQLYALLAREHGNGAYSALNALLRRLISFEQTLEASR